MKYKKILKFVLPLVGLTAISVALPVALTSCSTSSTDTTTPSPASEVLVPKNPTSIKPTAHNFNNSYSQVTEIANQNDADQQLKSLFNKMSNSEKQQAFENDLQNYVNSLYEYGEVAFAGMIKDPKFSNYDGKLNQTLGLFRILSDPTKKVTLDNSYDARIYVQPEVSNIQWNNTTLSFVFVLNSVLQIRHDQKVIAQANIVTTCKYANLSPEAIAVKKSDSEPTKNYSTWIIKSGSVTISQSVQNIITNQNTPITDYFAKNINDTFYTQEELKDLTSHNSQFNYGFKLLPTTTYNINASNNNEPISLGLDAYYWDLALNGYKPTNLKESDPIIFMAPSLQKVYTFNSNVNNGSGNHQPA